MTTNASEQLVLQFEYQTWNSKYMHYIWSL